MNETTNAIQQLINAWSIDIFGGWSMMDFGALGAFLIFLVFVIQYYYARLGK